MELSLDELHYFKQLAERQQRIYVGLKAKSLGWLGLKTVSLAYVVDVKTIRKGKAELSNLPDSAPKRIQKSGGGKKK